MATEIKYCFSQECDLKIGLFNETTGDYSLGNQTGYNTPNQPSSGITSAQITMYPPGYITPIVFRFAIVNNYITEAYRTDEYGNITDIFADINSILFPFVNFEFDSKLIYGDNGDSILPDGSWRIIYINNNGPITNSIDAYNYFIGESTRCRDSAGLNSSAGLITRDQAIDVFYNYDQLLIGVSLGNNTYVDEQVDVLKGLCRHCNNTKNC